MMVTNERIYSTIYGYIKNSNEFDNLDEWLKKNEKLPESNDLWKMVNLLIDIRQDMASEEAEKRGSGSIYKSMMKIIKNSKKCNSNASIHSAWEQDGKLYVTDGFSAIRTIDHLDLPVNEKNHPNMDGVFKIAESNKRDGFLLDLPKLSELKTHIKIKKAEIKASNQKGAEVPWEFSGHKVRVNAEYLLNILSCIPDCKAYTKGNNSTIFFESENTEAVLMPMRW